MESSFAKRIFISNFRLYDHEGLGVISLGVLADNQADWRPDTFGYGRWGSEMRLRYPIVKLLDYGADWTALEQNPNPFAIVVMAHLKTQTTHHRSRDRLRWKVEVVTMLYKRGYTRTDIYNLLRFIDWIMVLSSGLDRTFWQEVETIQEAKPMKYVLSIERIARQDGKREGKKEGKKEGIKEGIKEGRLSTAREDTLEILHLRFNSVPEELITAINQLTDLPQLKALHKQTVITGTIEEFEQFLETYKIEQNTSG